MEAVQTVQHRAAGEIKLLSKFYVAIHLQFILTFFQ